MSAQRLEDFSDIQLDVLKEIANIGAGNATTSLSNLLNASVDMSVPTVRFLEFKELGDIIGGAENLIVGILLTLENDLDGMMMFIMEKDAAHKVVSRLMGRPAVTFDDFDEMDLSALREIGNIIAGSYLSSISSFTNLVITSSVPYLSIDMAGAILSVPAIEFGKISDKALLIQSRFGDENTVVDGYYILIPTLESFNKIFSSFGL